jgi:hypothetical protein
VFLNRVNNLYQGLKVVRDDRYIDFTKVLLQQIQSYSNFQQDVENYDTKKMVDEKSNKKRFCVSEVLTSKVILLAKL